MSKAAFKKILIANRGEIAVRVIRTCREMGIETVAVYSEVDREALHVRLADEAYLLGPAPAAESYLCIDKVIKIAKKAKVQAIHPGYGFLSENADLAEVCKKARVTFIGPSAETMRAVGDKISARHLAGMVKVPIVPGIDRPLQDAREAAKLAAKFGYPVILKARAGGGGKGMRRVNRAAEMESAFSLASSEAKQSFGDPELYLEKCLVNPHHVEVQILGDKKGRVVALGERECSAQRRHQKIVEETPSPFISEATRKKLLEAAVKIGRAAKYENAGTVEFLVDKNQRFYFLEVNARLQVEHPVTEAVTGIDLVRKQIEIASGVPLSPLRERGQGRGGGHSLECRIYAEDPDQNFLPSPGKITSIRNPEGPGVRVDSAIYEGCEISVYYDPLIAKLITWGRDREEALLKMRRALSEYRIGGVQTNLSFLRSLLDRPEFGQGQYDTHFVERSLGRHREVIPTELEEIAAMAVLVHQKVGRGEPVRSPSEIFGSPWQMIARQEGMR